MLNSILIYLNNIWLEIQEVVIRRSKIISIIISIIILWLMIKIIILPLLKIIIKMLKRVKCEFIKEKKKVDNKVKKLTSITKSFAKSGLIDKKSFVKLPNDLCDGVLKNYGLLVKTGVTLMFPPDVLKWYFGSYIDLKPKDNNCQESDGLRVILKQIIFKADKLTRVTIEISNVGNKQLNFSISKSKFKESVELKLNDIYIVEVEDINDRQPSSDKILMPNQTKEIEILFNYLDKDIIREIKKVEFIFINSYRKNVREFKFSLSIPATELHEIKNAINKEFDLKSFFGVLSCGGFIFIAIVLNSIIRFIGNISGGYFKFFTLILSIFVYILAINLNYKFISIVFDFLSSRVDKD